MKNLPLILYECPASRSDRIKFMLEEFSIPYEKKPINLMKGEHKSKEFLDLNPFGAVPFIQDPETGISLSESGAICIYLSRKFKKISNYPEENSPERIKFDELMFFAASSLDPICLQIYQNTKFLPPEKRIPSLAEDGVKKFHYCIQFLNVVLKDKKFLMGNKISAPDFMVATTLLWLKEEVKNHQILQNYMQNILELPSLKKVRKEVKEFYNE